MQDGAVKLAVKPVRFWFLLVILVIGYCITIYAPWA